MLEKVSLKTASEKLSEINRYYKLGEFNGNSFSLLKTENRALNFHTHENSDELFFCIDGDFFVEYIGENGRTESIKLSAGECLIVPKNVSHRPVVDKPVVCVLAERIGELNPSNTGGGKL